VIYCTTVYRGVNQGRHGILYQVDIETEEYKVLLDYNDEIDYSGRGGDRGLRGIVKFNDELYVCVSKSILKLDLNGNVKDKLEHPYLGWLHEVVSDDTGFSVVSTMYDAVLHYNIVENTWDRIVHVNKEGNLEYFSNLVEFEPKNVWHLNSISRYTLSGLRLPFILPSKIQIPYGTHNTRIINGVLFYNDTEKNTIVFGNKSYKFDSYTFLRGATFTDDFIIVGQSPASLHILDYNLNYKKHINLSPEKNSSIQSIINTR
jgi:hypothetical protein